MYVMFINVTAKVNFRRTMLPREMLVPNFSLRILVGGGGGHYGRGYKCKRGESIGSKHPTSTLKYSKYNMIFHRRETESKRYRDIGIRIGSWIVSRGTR